MKKVIAILIILLAVSCKNSTKTEVNSFKKLTDLVDGYAENTLQNGNINSIALAIYRNGKVYKNYFGEIDKGKNNIPNDNTLYEIASITKVFTGSLAAKAVLENKINLDDDIRKYLEENYDNYKVENTRA